MSIDIHYVSEALSEAILVEIEDEVLARYVEIEIRKAEIVRLLEEIDQTDNLDNKLLLKEYLRDTKKVLRELNAWRKARRSKK